MAIREEIRVPEMGEPMSHYTDAVRVGDVLFLSGCGALNSDGELVGGDDIVAQAQKVFENMGTILRAARADFDDVAKLTVYLTDAADRVKINPVRKQFFGESRPASTLIQVSGFAVPGMKIEVDAIAAWRGGLPSQ